MQNKARERNVKIYNHKIASFKSEYVVNKTYKIQKMNMFFIFTELYQVHKLSLPSVVRSYNQQPSWSRRNYFSCYEKRRNNPSAAHEGGMVYFVN